MLIFRPSGHNSWMTCLRDVDLQKTRDFTRFPCLKHGLWGCLHLNMQSTTMSHGYLEKYRRVEFSPDFIVFKTVYVDV